MIDNDTNTTEPLQAAVGTEPQMVGYVTFLADGTLDGSYFQVPPEEHLIRMIEVDDAIRAAWVNYRANDARDGVELLPPAAPAPVDLDALKAAAIGRTYADVDAVYDAAIGRRATEYQEAEAAARAFADAGYAGDVSEYVSDYALHNPTGTEQSNLWAADQIIARADAFRAAQKAMRTQRFAGQAAMRAATTPEQLAAAQESWAAFITETRAELGL
jgi:hypothetical protein